ncbi:MAG: ATP-binding protein [Ilumatobacteraceae bacterium]
MASANPFRPSFGNSPPVLAGRDELIEQFAEALDDGPGAPGRATLYTGARGTGKTVMLNEVADVARQRGWLVVEETASPGVVTRLVTQHLPALLTELDPRGRRITVKQVTGPLGVGAIAWDSTDRHVVAAGLRNQLELACDLLAGRGTGLLLTLDEVHGSHTADLRDVFVAVQHLFRNDREIAVAAAGLPSAISSLLNDEVLTFLRRADRHTLGQIEPDEVERALRETIEGAGRTISAAACRAAAAATGGYPFLIQLVGYHVWRRRPGQRAITVADVDAGAATALARMESLVHEPALADLSGVDRAFLAAMAMDDGPSRIGDVAKRLDVELGYTSVYRQRLIDAQMIEPAGHGLLRFTLPRMAEHLRRSGVVEQVALNGRAAAKQLGPPS